MEDQQIEEKKEETAQEPKDTLGDFMEICESIITSIFVVLLIFTFICRPVTVDGGSMQPTLNEVISPDVPEDKLLMTTFFYTPKVGDIVVVENDESHYYKNGDSSELVTGTGLGKRLIKRVIATAGQTVDIDFENGIVYVDGEALSESYIKEPTYYNSGAFEYPVTVPEGYVFVMGDNRNNSTDSRDPHVGFVKEDDVLGKAVLRFYPFEKFKVLD
ncbi:MAG: signal peptidase I [Porcipelethomonas sp.]